MNIAGIPKAKILAALFNAASPPKNGPFQGVQMHVTDAWAEENLVRNGHLSLAYVNGVELPVDVTTDEYDSRSYNTLYGDGAAERVVAELRERYPI